MIRFVKHYSTKIELPIYKFNNSTFMFDSITIEDDSFMITGSVHDLHEAETSRMIITQQNEVVVYGAHDYIEDTNHFDLDLIKNFVQFFKDNIFIKYCDSKHTITNKIMLSLDDSKELMNWARSY